MDKLTVVLQGSSDIRLRLFANAIDYFLCAVIFALDIVLFGHQISRFNFEVNGWPAFALLVFWFIYFPGCESWFGRTLGHWAFKFRVINKDRSTPSFIESLK